MPVINASAGIADSLAKGLAQGTENFVDQRRISEQQATQKDQFDRALEQRKAEYDIRKDERGRILGQRQNEIAQDTRRIREGGDAAIGQAGLVGAVETMAEGHDPSNPMFWGYAGQKIAQEVGRLGEEIQRFEAVVGSMGASGQRDLVNETLGKFSQEIQGKQDKLKRYGATSQINEWLSLHPDDADIFGPIIDGVKQGQFSSESALSQLYERKAEAAARVGQVTDAQTFRQNAPQFLATLPQGVGQYVGSVEIESIAQKIEAGAPLDSAYGDLFSEALTKQTKSRIALNDSNREAAELEHKARVKARTDIAKGDIKEPPVDKEVWKSMKPREREDALTRFYMGKSPIRADPKPTPPPGYPRIKGKGVPPSDEDIDAMIADGLSDEEIQARSK